MSSSIYTARYVLKTNRSIEICPPKNTTTHKAADAGVIREGLASITNLRKTQHSSFSPLAVVSSKFAHTGDVRIVFLERGVLEILPVVVRTLNHGPPCPLHSRLIPYIEQA